MGETVEWLKLLTNIGALLAVLASPLIAWLATKFVLRREFGQHKEDVAQFKDKVEKDLRSMSARISKTDRKVADLPSRSELRGLETDMKKVSGELRAVSARIDGLNENLSGANGLLQTLLEDRLQRDNRPQS